MTRLSRQVRINEAVAADLHRTLFRMSETPPPRLSLADALGGGIKADALAQAWDRFCEHHDRARLNAEVKAIQSCNIERIGQ